MGLFGRLLILPMLAIVLVLGGAQVALAATPAFQYGAQEMAKLTASDGIAGDQLGTSAAISGDTAVIGSPGDADLGNSSGAAYVYTRSGTTWTQQAKLKATGGVASEYFGNSVAISGDTVVIGAPTNGSLGAAHAYVFTRTGTTWTQQQKLEDSKGYFDAFGCSVAVSGDTAVIGASEDGANGTSAGAAYVFTRSGTTWTLQKSLAGASTLNDFGNSVAISGDTAVVAAKGVNGNRGAAYVYTRSGTNWAQQQMITDPAGQESDLFGSSVAVEGDTALIGAIYGGGTVLKAGSAFIYTRTGTSWTQQQKLTDSVGAAYDEFGGSVALSGDTVVIGAKVDDGVGLNTGSAFVFTRTGTAWTQRAKLNDAGEVAGDYFGISVAISGTTVVVGQPYDKGAFWGEGSAFVFGPAAPAYPTLTYGAGADGSIEGSATQVVASGSNGTTVTATPATGYHFESWSDAYPTAVRQDLNVVDDKSVTANFAINTYRIAYLTDGTPGSSVSSSTQTVAYGSSAASVMAVAPANHHFVNWTGTGGFVTTIINPVIVAAVTADATLTAIFADDTTAITVTGVAGSASKTYDGAPSASVTCTSTGIAVGDVVTISSTAAFADDLVGTDKTVSVSGITLSGTDANKYTLSNTTASTTADIAAKSLTITADDQSKTYGNTLTFAGTEFVSSGLVSGDSITSVALASSGAAATAVPGTYTVTPSAASGVGLGNYDISYHTGTLTVTGGSFTVRYTPTAGGSVEGSATQVVFHGANCSAVTATATAGYHFVNWSGTGGFVTTTTNPLTISNVTADATLTATFAPTAPTVVSALAASTTQIDVLFSAPLDAATVAASDFTVPGLTVSAAALQPGNTTVRLTANAQKPGTTYTVTVGLGSVSGASGATLVAPNTATLTGHAGPWIDTVPADGIVVSFDSASVAGTVTATVPGSFKPAPSGFALVAGSYFDLSTTTTFNSSDGFNVTLSYDPTKVTNSANLHLYHWEGSAWVDITTGVNAGERTVTGHAHSFSDYTIMESGGSGPPVSTPASSDWSLALLAMGGLVMGWVIRRKGSTS